MPEKFLPKQKDSETISFILKGIISLVVIAAIFEIYKLELILSYY